MVELADRIAREKLLIKYGVLDDSGYDDDLENVPMNCSFCSWTTEKRKDGRVTWSRRPAARRKRL